MAGSSFGTLFTITTWGESHGKGVGVVVDGCPAGLPLCEEDIQYYLNLRRPGQSAFTTARSEKDQVSILSGVFEGKTTGTPISMLVWNTDQHSGDYSNVRDNYRPGHADYTYDQKYGFRDYRGGGRSSGRETIGRVAGGAVAMAVLKHLGISIRAYASSIGPVKADMSAFDADEIRRNPFCLPDAKAAKLAEDFVSDCKAKKDSAGGVIECVVDHLPAGLGQPVFDKLDAVISQGLMSMGAVKGVSFGEGFHAAELTGSDNNDAFFSDGKTICKKTNHSGGVLGGMSDGSRLVIQVAVKPTPSISQEQETVNRFGENTTLIVKGRHDPLIVPRAVVVVESMVAVTLVDMLLQNMGSRMEYLERIYR